MFKKRILLFLIFTAILFNLNAQFKQGVTKAYYNDSTLLGKKRVLRAVGSVVGLNLGIWAFDRYALNADYAMIGFSTIRKNLETGFLWDNDMFPTNLFAHPYHGSMYFNAGRSNGLSFWQSVPLAVGGSAMWELFMENQPPSLNDIIATPIGGMILGEITHRLSLSVLDGSKTGAERVGRELLGAALNPISALNRMIDGSMWKVKRRSTIGMREYPIVYTGTLGMRFVSEGASLFKGGLNPYMKLSIAYGDPFGKENTKPYDYFTVSTTLNLLGKQPLFGTINARGLLWGLNYETNDGQKMLLGIFQHFNYYDSKSTVSNSDLVPYKLAETASFGAGTIYKLSAPDNKTTAVVGMHFSGIILGGTMSDVYHVGERTYNMGSGYSAKVLSLINVEGVGSFNLTGDFYNLFTWKGYDQNIDWEKVDDYYLNAQGDESNTLMLILSPSLSVHLTKNISLSFGADFYLRETSYKYYNPVNYRSHEVKAGITFSH